MAMEWNFDETVGTLCKQLSDIEHRLVKIPMATGGIRTADAAAKAAPMILIMAHLSNPESVIAQKLEGIAQSVDSVEGRLMDICEAQSS